MSAQSPSPAASGGDSPSSSSASSPSSNGSAPRNNSSPPPQQIQPSSPPPTTSPPPASSPPPPSTNSPSTLPVSPPPTSSPSPPSNSSATPPSSPPPAQSPPPPSNAPPPAEFPPPPANAPPLGQSPPPRANAPPPIQSPRPPANAPPPAQSPPPPANAPLPSQSPQPPANASPPTQSPPPKLSPPPKSIPPSSAPPIKPSTPPPAEPPSNPTSPSPPIDSPPSSSPSPPSPPSASPPKSSPTLNSPPPKESPPPPETPTPAGTPSPPSPSIPGSPPSSKTPTSTSPPPPQSSSSPTPNSTLPGGTSSPSSSGGVPTAAIAGGAVGVLVVLAIFGVLFWYIRKKKRRDNYPGNYHGPPPPGSFSRKSDGVYPSNSPSSVQYPGKASPSPPVQGYGHDNGYQGSKWSSGDAVGVPQAVTPGLGNSKSWFTYEELAIATDGFSPQNVLGEGGFGCVYKGYLQGGKVIAVKQLKIGGGQGEREFRAEVEIISRVHHRHLVSLVGYCIADSQRLLVYDYVPNGTVEYHLHGRGRPVMDWPTRLRIAVGAARGIAYLHEDCHPRIIHRDIKSANILLDDRFEAQVSDFGLAKLALDAHTHVTTRVMGTFGYMAPEYASSGKLTQRSDVFSFGVVLLELVTGRKPVDTSQPLGDESLVEWARPLLSHSLEEGNFEALVDPRLENNFDHAEMFRMIEAAAACVRHSAQRRPRMGQVVRALESDAAITDLNNGVKPGESAAYNSAQYSADIRRFRRMAFGSRDVGSDFSGVSSEYDMNPSTSSSEFHKSKEVEAKLSRHWKTDLESASGSEYLSSESETRPINMSRSHKDETGERSSGEVPTNFRGQSIKGR